MALSTNEIINLSSFYVKDFNLREEDHLNNIKEILRQHGNKLFYIYRYISFAKDFLILSKSGKFTIEVPSKSEYYFLERLQKACYMKVIKRKKGGENSAYQTEIYLTIDVYY